jgi:type II secretory pathway component PulF
MGRNDQKLWQRYWLRQLAALLERGRGVDEALAGLIKIAEEGKASLVALADHHARVGRLAGLPNGGLLPDALLQLLDKVSAKQEAALVARYQRLQQSFEPPTEVFFSRLQALAGYFSVLAILLVLLVNFIVQMILGPFSEMYSGLGHSLPTPTDLLLGLTGHADLIQTVSIVLLVLIPIVLLSLRLTLRHRHGFPSLLRLIPFVGGARRAFLGAETLLMTEALVQAGVHYEKALFTAIQLADNNRELTGLEPLLGHAAQLGTIDEELSYHSQRLMRQFEHQGRLALQRLMISAYLLIGLLVGCVVLAAYLPIFQLGAMI